MTTTGNPHPVLLPLGWPFEANDKEALVRVLLAAGADIERLLDAPVSSLELFIRHASRMAVLRSTTERPIVAFVPRNDSAAELLESRSVLLRSLPRLKDSLGLVYLGAALGTAFLALAAKAGDLSECGPGLYAWDVGDGVLLLVGPDTGSLELRTNIEDLLALSPYSTLGRIDSRPIACHKGLVTTEPSPPSSGAIFRELPYAALTAHRHLDPPRLPGIECAPEPTPTAALESWPVVSSTRTCLEAARSASSSPPASSPFSVGRSSSAPSNVSSMPPNPRVRKG